MKTFLTFFMALFPFTVASAAPGRSPGADWEKSSTAWSSGDYVYDAAGNVIAIGTDVYRYDALGRLVSGTAKTPGYPANLQQYAYDRYGNLLTVTTSNEGGSGQIALAVDPLTNQLDGTCPPNVPCMTGAYDQSGNQTGLMPNDGLYRWDDLGMMTQISAPGRMQRYLYDANGERIAALTIDASGNVVKARYTLRGSDHKVARELVHDRVANTWTRTRDYVYRAGTLMAVFDATSTSSAPDRHYHVDHLGTPRMVSDRGGTTQALHTYWPFGQEAPGSDRTKDADRLRFTGHERDAAEFETAGAAPQPGWDLDYMHARYYNPNGGRFLSVDPARNSAKPARPQTWNRYAYVMNNPLKAVDSDGKRTAPVFGRTADVEPGYVLVIGDAHGHPKHVAMVVGVHRGPYGEMTTTMVEHVPREKRQTSRTGSMSPDMQRHKLQVVDSNSAEAGGDYWSMQKGHTLLAVVPNRTTSGAPHTETAILAAVAAINKEGGLQYNSDETDGKFATETDCAGAVDQLLALLGGDLGPLGGKGFMTIEDFHDLPTAVPVK